MVKRRETDDRFHEMVDLGHVHQELAKNESHITSGVFSSMQDKGATDRLKLVTGELTFLGHALSVSDENCVTFTPVIPATPTLGSSLVQAVI